MTGGRAGAPFAGAGQLPGDAPRTDADTGYTGAKDYSADH